MACPDRLSQWTHEVSTAFAHLSKPHMWGLVLWSAGIALSGVAGISQISALLAIVLQEQEQTVFQRLREWYLDATSLGNRWTILAISVVIRGCAIPVAWKVLPAEQPGSWRPYWEGLLNELNASTPNVRNYPSKISLRPDARPQEAEGHSAISHWKHIGKAVPPEWDVLVLADRGLYARWLWDAIVAWDWHPFLRINVGSKARVAGEEHFDWISRWVPTPGTRWQGKVECFASKKGRVNGTLLMHWEPGYASAWIILTDLESEEALVSWYGLRTWIEGGFKDAQTWTVGLATQQNGASKQCGAVVVGDGSGAALVCESGMPGGGSVRGAVSATRAWGSIA